MAIIPGYYPPNPYFAFVEASIDGFQLTTKNDRPQRLTGFTYTKRGTSAGNYVQLTVFDSEWTTVESAITSSKDAILKFQFGYTTGVYSPVYEAIIINYKPTFTIDGVQLTIEAISKGFGEVAELQRSRNFPEVTGNKEMEIHEIVKWIADERGWEIDFDETDTNTDNHNLELSGPERRHFIQHKMRDMQFIINVLSERAIRKKDGTADYKVFFEDNAKPKLHFHPMRVDTAPVVRSFTFMRDKMSEVISFSPDLSAQALLKLGGGVSACPYINLQTGEYEDVIAKNENTPDKTTLGGNLTFSLNETDEYYSVVESRPIRDGDDAQIAAMSRYMKMYMAMLRATLVIQGDPRMEPHTIIEVMVLMPNGKYHYSSGLWYVLDVTNNISGGQYTSSMELVRSGFKKTEPGIKGDPVVGKVREA